MGDFDLKSGQDTFRTPHCCWYQRQSQVFLTVEVMDCQEPDISVLDDKLLFTCHAEGQKYQLDLKLLHDINTKVTTYHLPTILL